MPEGPLPREELAGLLAGSDVLHLVLRRLARRPGHWVMTIDLVEAVYGHRRDGGADNASEVVRSAIFRLKPIVLAAGWCVEGNRGRDGGYRLVLA